MTVGRGPGRHRPLLRVAALAGILAIAAATVAASDPTADSAGRLDSRPGAPRGAGLTGCTVIYGADESGAFGGNNEDGLNPLSRIWFVPGEAGALGSAFVGYDDMGIQGGVNEAGLFFDALGVREVEVPARSGKPVYSGPGENFVVEVMSACDSVRCAVERFEAVSMAGTWNGQFLFGDRFGASAIVEPLTIIPTEGSFQVATNFFQSEVSPAERTDDRYVTATSMLAEVDAFSPEVMRDVLAATRQQGQVTTVYSTVYELDSGVIHLYYFGDFETEVTFDIGAELAKGVHGYEIGTLVASNEPATARALPIRRRLEAIKDGLPTSAVDPASLVGLAGTYEAPPYLTVIVEATGDGLAVRHPWTPPVPLTALSPSEFAFAYSDFDGTAHDERLHFRAAGLGGPGQVRIEEDGTDTVVATLGGGSAASWPAMVLLLRVLLAGGSVGWWMRAHRRPEGSASVHSAPSRRRTIPTPHDARPRPLLPGMRHPRS